ncbi:hypothetical protein [Hymenobacter sp. APR13]|uniref:hypothetical protein n=1 Tax=Hymenobacter sp. APR13 TaxID=1356852 RepID=UPI0012E0ABF4|nr:hypothetical protein [Hymenobacter sp. APR13]
MTKKPSFGYRPARQGYRRPATVFRAAAPAPAPARALPPPSPTAGRSTAPEWALAA